MAKKDVMVMAQAMDVASELHWEVSPDDVYPILLAGKDIDKVNKFDKTESKKTNVNGENDTPSDTSSVMDTSKWKNFISNLGLSLQDRILSLVPGNKSLQDKIHFLLSLLDADLSNQELNQILKGEKKVEDVLPIDAQIMWNMIFYEDAKGRDLVREDVVNSLIACAASYAEQELKHMQEREIENHAPMYESKEIAERNQRHDEKVIEWAKEHDVEEKPWRNIPEKARSAEPVDKTREELDPELIEKKLGHLKVYINTMQGYDKDRDRDGGRGIDMKTGEVIDFEDAYIADKKKSPDLVKVEHPHEREL